MRHALSLVAAFPLFACTAAEGPDPGPGGKGDGTSEALVIGPPPGAGDGFSVGSVRVDGDALLVEVSFGGGCEEHSFTLFWDGEVLDAQPPQVQLVLHHDGNGDACEALLHRELAFDLTPLGDSMAAQDLAEVHLLLDGGSDDLVYRPALQALQLGEPEGIGDGYQVQDARIEGDLLTLSVSFGGGCQEHDFALFWDGALRETLPPQATLVLTHDSHGDHCEALVSRELVFDLSPLREGAGEGVDRVLIGLAETEVSLEYALVATPALVVGEPDGPGDSYQVTAARVDGDVLVIAVRYGGGCQEHDFTLFWDGAVAESLPPQVTLQLVHDGHQDFCESLRSEELRFDLAPLRAALEGTDQVSVTIEGGDQPAHVTYTL